MTHVVSRFDRILHRSLAVLAAVLIPLALIVGLGRELLPYIGEQKPRIEQWLSAKAGLDIRFASIEGDWRQLSPILTARNISLRDPAHPDRVLLTLPSISTTPDWWATLRDRSPRLRTTLSGLQLTVLTNAQGEISVQEFAGLGQSDPAKALQTLRWLLAQPGLSLQNNQLRWRVAGEPDLKIRDLRLTQFNGHNDYRLQVGFRLEQSDIEQQALLVMSNDPLQWRKSPWQVYLQLNNLPVWQPWLRGLQTLWPLPAGWRVQLREGNLKLWLSSSAGAPTAATAVLGQVAAALNVPGYAEQVASSVSGVMSAQRKADAWVLGGDDLSGRINGMALPLRRFAVDYSPTQMTLAAARMSLPQLQAHAQRLQLIPTAWSARIAAANVQGVLPRVHLQLQRGQTGWKLQVAEAEFKAFSMQPEGRRPGVERMAGWFRSGVNAGMAYFDTRQARILLPEIFHEPITVDRLEGGLRWQHRNGLWHIDSDVLRLVNADAEASAQFALRLPEANPADGQLELLAGLRKGKVASAWRYVPWHSAGEHTLAWLKRSLVAGDIEQATFLHTGPLRGGAGGGHLDMQFNLKNATLDYLPGWPALSDLDAVVDISDHALRVRGERGRILSAQASKLVAEIPDLKHATLSIDTDLSIDLADVDRLLAESPLRRHTEAVAQRLELSGPAQAHLALRVPLATGMTDVRVDAQLKDAVLALPNEKLRFEQVNGALSFDSRSGLDAKALQARFWQQPATIQLQGERRGGRWWQQKVQVQTPVDMVALSRWSEVDISRYARGTAPVSVAVNLPVAAPGLSSLSITSNLLGTQILLPAPLGKAAGVPLPLRYQTTLGNNQEHKASAIVGNDLRVGIVSREGRIQRALLRYGVPGLAWPAQPGLVAELRAPKVNAVAWQSFLARPVLTVQGRKDAAAGLPELRQISLETDDLQLGEERFASTRIRAVRQDKGWDLQVKGLQPLRWPNWPVTEVAATLQSQGSAWQLSPLTVKQPLLSFAGSVAWGQAGNEQTLIKGQLDAADIGEVMAQMGIAHALSSDSVAASGELSWPGAPNEFSLSQSSGSVDATLKQGHLKEVSGVNLATRVFGLINASNLLRRLRFDFTDITRKGLNYDRITVKGDLKQGVFKPAQFDLEGPTVQIRGRGWVNLNNQTLDQQLRVGVPVSSAVPVLAGFLAGPIVGGALVAADLLLDKQLAKLTSVRYRVTGPWDALVVDDETLESLPASVLKAEKAEAGTTEAKP
ncbi:MAG: AsmA-like C-terminal region-containing protein [Pseudomonadota bacterium]